MKTNKDTYLISNDISQSEIDDASRNPISKYAIIAQKNIKSKIPSEDSQDEIEISLGSEELRSKQGKSSDNQFDLANQKLYNRFRSDKNGQRDSDELNTENELKSRRIISDMIHVFLAITGIYVTFFGFRIARLLMTILGFYVSYYTILFVLTEMKAYDIDNIGHQLGLFFGCIILGFFFSIMCYLFEKVNFFIFGAAVGCMISLLAAQFFIDFRFKQDRIVFITINVVTFVAFTVISYILSSHAMIWGSVFIGAIIFPLNIGVLLDDFKSFEVREKLPSDRYSDFIKYVIIGSILIFFGVLSQYYLRNRIVKGFKNNELENIRVTDELE